MTSTGTVYVKRLSMYFGVGTRLLEVGMEEGSIKDVGRELPTDGVRLRG